MTSTSSRLLVACSAALALAFPVTAAAHHGGGQGGPGVDAHHGRGHNEAERGGGKQGRALILEGTVSAVGTDSVQVDVKHANHHGSGLVGQTVTVDVSNARIVVADVNGDGVRDLSDVAVGDRVVVQARVAKGVTPDPSQPVVAGRFVDVGARHAGGGKHGAGDAPGSGDTGGSGDTSDSPDHSPPPAG